MKALKIMTKPAKQEINKFIYLYIFLLNYYFEYILSISDFKMLYICQNYQLL